MINKKMFLIALAALMTSRAAFSAVDPNAVTLTRMFSKDFFEMNGVPYLQPMVQAVNATSNSRFFNQAYIPPKVDKPYFKVGLHGMFGFVPESKKTFVPQVPNEPFNLSNISKYGSFEIDWINPANSKINITDTAGLMYYAFKTVIYDGIHQNRLHPPTSSCTILGSQKGYFLMPKETLDSLVREHFIFPYLPKNMQDSLLATVKNLPHLFSFPEGGNMDYIFAAVPQIEIGSLYGTELLLRFIPRVNMGKNIGDFMFWGIGLKHSISQYFGERYFDLAIQGVYQGTNLKNTIGVTNSILEANASMWNLNLHASKSFEDVLDVYTGLSFEFINIKSDYKYYLPVETQHMLGLLERDESNADTTKWRILPPGPGFPGDTVPQYSHIKINSSNFKWVIGVTKEIGPMRIYLDYSLSQFDLFTGGIEFRF